MIRLTSRSSLETVAFAVGDTLRRGGIRAVMTGGAAAAIHSRGAYSSLDVDFVLSGNVDRARMDAALSKLGFRWDRDHYVHPHTQFTVDFPRGPLAIGSDLSIRPVLHARGATKTLMLSATDSCRDRLAAFYFWKDRQSLKAAIDMARVNRVNLQRIARWSASEGHTAEYEVFLRELRAVRS